MPAITLWPTPGKFFKVLMHLPPRAGPDRDSEGPFIVEDDRAGRRDGTSQSAKGACGKTGRHRHRDLHRRALRARDVRNNRSGVKRSKVFRTGVDDLPEI